MIDHEKTEPFDYTELKVEANEFFRDYRACLLELTERERKVLMYWLDKNMDHSYTLKEIADELGVSPTTVANDKKKALKKIKENPRMQKYKGLI